MKLTNNSYYWDCNATSPLAQSVLDWLKEGDVSFANPSSVHSLGIQAKQKILETEDYLLNFFHLKKTHDIFFHSGASESINTILRSAMEDEKASFHCFKSDHSTTFNIGHYFLEKNRTVHFYEPSQEGDLPYEKLAQSLKDCSKPVLNYTWVNSESGVCWPLDSAARLKKDNPHLFVHVDAVQAPGKIENFKNLDPDIDAYTFSGHKVGSLKGIGFSFLKKKMPFTPFVLGGGQQRGLRSGTENVSGIYSLKLALEELSSKSIEKSLDAKNYFEKRMKEQFSDKIKIIGEKAKYRNYNTSLILFNNIPINIFLTALDMANIYVSSGSACSSGQLKPSRVLMSMGHEEQQSMQGIRFSFAATTDRLQIDQGLEVLSPIIRRFLDK